MNEDATRHRSIFSNRISKPVETEDHLHKTVIDILTVKDQKNLETGERTKTDSNLEDDFEKLLEEVTAIGIGKKSQGYLQGFINQNNL